MTKIYLNGIGKNAWVNFWGYLTIILLLWQMFVICVLVTGPWSGYLGASFVSANWGVRVFWSSGLVDRPSDRIYVRTITLSGCMGRRSRYIPFYYQSWLAWHRKTFDLAASPEELSPYGIPRRGTPGPWTFLDDWTAWGLPHTKTVSYNIWEAYNLGVISTLVTRFHLTQYFKNETQAAHASEIHLVTSVG